MLFGSKTPRPLAPVSGPIDPDASARIDVLRIILIGLIVLCHGGRFLGSTTPVDGRPVQFFLAFLNEGIDSAVVPLFFCISGFLFLRKATDSLAAYKTMLQKKFVSIFIPFLIFNAIWIIYVYAVDSIDMFGSRGFIEEAGIVRKLFGIGTLPFNYPLWFLRDLLLVFLATPVFLFFFKRLPRIGLVLLLALWFLEAPTRAYSLFGFGFAFYLGGYLARTRANISGAGGWDRFAPPAFFAMCALIACQPWLDLNPYLFFAFEKVSMAAGMICFWRVSGFGFIKESALLHRLATFSFFIYLTHEPTVSVLQNKMLEYWTPTGGASQIFAYFLPGATAIFLLYGLGRLLRRFFPLAYAVASGSPRRKKGATKPLGREGQRALPVA